MSVVGAMNAELKAAYEQLNLDHPGIFKGCPLEYGKTRVKKNDVAYLWDAFFDAGLCFVEEYFEREPATLTGDAFSGFPERTREGTDPERKRATQRHRELRAKTRYDMVPYAEAVDSRIERSFMAKSEGKDASYRDGLTGTGATEGARSLALRAAGQPEQDVVPFSGYQGLSPKRSTKVWLDDLCATRWKESQSSASCHLPKWVQRWVGCAPSDLQVTEVLPQGLWEQIKAFGTRDQLRSLKKYGILDSLYGVKDTSSPRKYQLKVRALDKVLSCAFNSRGRTASDACLSLDTCPVEGEESSWTPVTEDPLWVLINGEEMQIRTSSARYELGRVRDHVGAEKYLLLIDSANGMTSVELGEKYGKDSRAMKKAVQRVKKACQALTCPL